MSLEQPKHGNSLECHYWGYSFKWTDRHTHRDVLFPMTKTFDTTADDAVKILNEMPWGGADASGEKRPFHRDLYGLLKEHANEDPKLKKLWDEINTVPEWVDWDQIKRGQEVFFRYGLPILNTLGFQSLLGGMGAIRVVETLSRTGGFGAKVVRRRLLETLQHVLQVSMSLEGMKPGGKGSESCVRVRMLHSAVRLRILSLIEESPDYYDIDKFGVPVNDLDCIGTINTFCSAPIWVGLPRQGIHLSEQEAEDYVALWRLVAYYMGTPTDGFETAPKARALMESLLITEFDPSETGQILAKNIIIGLENTAPAYASKGFLEAMSRLLNGDQLSDALDLPRPNIYYRSLVWGYCFWVQTVARTVPKIWFLDRLMISLRRKNFYKQLMDEKQGLGKETRFAFKYIPTLTRRTQLGERRTIKFERLGIESLARLGLLAAFAAIATLGLGFVFAARMIPAQLYMIRA